MKALKANEELRASFLNVVKEEMQKLFMQSGSNLPEQMNANIVKLLKTAAESTLPKLSKKRVKEIVRHYLAIFEGNLDIEHI